MHRHRKVWPLVQGSYSQARSTATAARTKPRDVVPNAEPAIPTPRPLGKWALPTGTYARPSTTTTTSPENHSRGESSRLSERGTGSRFNPPPPPSHLTRTRPPAQDFRQSRPNNHLSPPPSQSRTRASQTFSSATLSAKPQNVAPSASASNKWQRSIPQAPLPDRTHGTRTQTRNHSPIPIFRRSDHLPARDTAPHQDLPKTFTQHPPRHSYGDRGPSRGNSLAPRTGMLQQSPGSHLQSYPRTSEMPAHARSQTPKGSSSTKDSAAPAVHAQPRYVRDGPQRNIQKDYKSRGSILMNINQYDNSSKNSALSQKQEAQKVKKKRVIEKKVAADVYIPSTVSVGTLARLLGVRLEHLQRQMRQAGMDNEAKYDHVLTSDYAVLLAEEFGRNPIVNDEAAFDIYPPPPHPDPSSLTSRPPVVTIMGHVDHGKTTLLDSLRSSSVAKGEAGGITQHIGAFSVPVPGGSADGPQSITFLDTPGHAAFSAMRARGAGVTDIVVLVVAADDGIMPQTKEVISLIKKDEGKVNVVVAINKVDKPGINVDAVQKALMAEGIQLEIYGGDIPSVEVSGLSGHGLPTLVETLSAMSEMQDLRAEREGPIQGYVLESKVLKGLGPVATVLVLRGCLKVGSHILSGMSQAKVRIMNDSTGNAVKAAYPGMAITVCGWKSLPNAGDEVLQGTEGEIKKAIANRNRKAEIEATLVDVEAINSNRRQERERRELELELGDAAKETLPQEVETGPKELRLVIKADVSGSAEAVEGALQGIGNKEAVTRIISSGVGDVSESDVMMAKAIGGMVVGFSVSTPRAIETLAAQNDVPICSSNIIYRLMDDIKQRVIALLPIIVETRVTGEATILQLFDINLKGKQTKRVAGCRVINGIVEKSNFARLVRNGEVIHEGMLDTMRILKKDVMEVRKGTECGLCFGTSFADLQEGDVIQMYEKIEKPGVL